MAFSIKIKRKGLFGCNEINLDEILKNCGFKYGLYNDFFVLDEGKRQGNSCILYNPQHIGRGIYYDGNGGSTVEISINMPTTQEDIEDFLALASEICRQLKKAEIHDFDNNKKYTLEELFAEKDGLIQLNCDELKRRIENSDFEERSWIMTAARWPIWFDKKMCEELHEAKDLYVLSALFHEKQNMDTYYAKPSLMRNRADGAVLAMYTFTEECPSIFPIDFNDFLMASSPQNPIKADKGMITFYIFSEQRTLSGMWDYKEFIQYAIEHGAERYDKAHVLIPEYTKADIEKITNSIYKHA